MRATIHRSIALLISLGSIVCLALPGEQASEGW